MTFLGLGMRWSNDDLSSGAAPLWSQIAHRLRAAIAAGEFKPGEILPSEAEINATFKVSRTTARASLDRLRQEGLISRQSGRGSIVLAPRIEQPVNQLASFAEDMRRRGLKASYATFTAAMTDTTDEAASGLGVGPGVPAFCIRRLLLANGEPMAMSVSWLAPAILAGRRLPTPGELDRGSLYEWLANHCGSCIGGGQEFIEAATADEAMARRLQVAQGAALLVARRRSRAADGDPVEYAVMHYRADRYRFSVDLTR